MSVRTTAQEIAACRMSPVTLVEQCLARIEKLEPRVHAWVKVDAEGARREAARLRQLALEKRIVGPLHGIPVAIKDLIDVAGWPTKAGSPLREKHVAEVDAPVVTRLRAAGAVLLGKTVTTQFASFDPSPTRNPWNLNHTPAGSSSGSAAAVATGMAPLALGTQTGGSITRPAAYCGVFGFKPTYGVISLEGVVPLSFTLDHIGVFARGVDDLALVWNVLRDEANRGTWPPLAQPPRIGVIEEFFFDPKVLAADVRACIEPALKRLEEQGAILTRVERLPVSFAHVHAMHRRIMAVEAAEYHRQDFLRDRAAYGPLIGKLMDEGLATSAVDYAQALQHRERFRRQMEGVFGECDVLLTPASNITAPKDLSTTGDPAFMSPLSHAGLPTVAAPCGLAAIGLPCSLQIIGRFHEEDKLMAVAAWCEPFLPRMDPIPAGVKGFV